MFPESKQKNRRLTAKERSEDIQDAIIWGRYVKNYLLETPYYKDVPITPKIPFVNFDLGFKH